MNTYNPTQYVVLLFEKMIYIISYGPVNNNNNDKNNYSNSDIT